MEANTDLAKKLQHHDWFYSYSDDYSVVRRGERAWDELLKLCKGVPVEELRPLWVKHAPKDFQSMFDGIFCR